MMSQQKYDCFVKFDEQLKKGSLQNAKMHGETKVTEKPQIPKKRPDQKWLLVRDRLDDMIILNPMIVYKELYQESDDKTKEQLDFDNQFLYKPKFEEIDKRLKKQ